MLHALALLGKPEGTSSYFRLTTRPVDQALSAVPDDRQAREERRRQALAGAVEDLYRHFGIDAETILVPEAAPVAKAAPVASNGHAAIAAPDDGAVKATPLARRVARAHGVALDDVVGTGPLGRVTRGDVLAKAGRSSPPVTVSAGRPIEPPAESAKGVTESVSLTRVQATIARRMAETKATVPEFQVETDAAMDLAIEFRLSCDHRILYGADAAQFLSEIRGLLEHPLRLTL